MELILQRQTISGEELAQRGLVNKAFTPDEDVVLEAKKLAARIASYSRPVVRMAKQAVLAGMFPWLHGRGFQVVSTDRPFSVAENHHLDAGMAVEKQLYYMTFSLDDFKVGTEAFLNKRQPDFQHR